MSYVGQPSEQKPDLSARVQLQHKNILDSFCRALFKMAAIQPYREKWCTLPLD
jgi:hypothetical protein